MPLRIPVGEGQVIIHLRVSTDPEDMLCVLGVKANDPPLGFLNLRRVNYAWFNNIMPVLSSSTSLVKAVLRVRQDDGSDIVYEDTLLPVAVGSRPASVAPQNVAYVVRKSTSLGGRRGRGRMFIPGVVETDVDNVGSLVSGGAIALWTTALAAFLASLGDPVEDDSVGNITALTIQHNNTTTKTVETSGAVRTTTVITGAAGPLPTLVTGLALDPKVGTQRRRLR